jgi:hypothetical protein
MSVRRLRFPVAPARIAALGVASLLLAVAALLSSDSVNYSRGFNPLALALVVCFVAALGLLLAVTLDFPPERAPWRRWRSGRWVMPARVAATILLAALAVVAFLLSMGFLNTVLFQPTAHAYWNDVISFNAANAQAVLSGRNPYTDDGNFLPTLIRYAQAPPTPIQGPIFGYGYNYPLLPRVFAIDRAYMRDPAAYASAFDPATLHSYPALSFLLYVPLVALGQDILWLHLLAYVALFVWLVALAPRDQRGWVALAAAAAVTIPLSTLMLDTEIVCLVFLLVAWRYRSRRWVSALALGLGCAFKQYCWLFAPFLLVDALLRYGWREALKRALIAGAAFLAPNLPFILMNPGAWLASVFLPVTGALFPQGMGLVALSLGRVLPGWPPLVYAVAELLAFAGALWLFVRYRRELQESVLLLALAPLIFAFRSPANYFAIAPWLALYALLAIDRNRAARAADARVDTSSPSASTASSSASVSAR